ncbi:hypothetical protein [Sorangium sp. So ce854]|uniref:hypothetical protein n=1 Tax=Sorangium sp. So ce854 TaxID=3133322 RepID=UPI003F5FA61A
MRPRAITTLAAPPWRFLSARPTGIGYEKGTGSGLDQLEELVAELRANDRA